MGTILSPLTPIFLFSNWRTAGTALAFSFRKCNDFYVFTEPLNPTLRNADMALSSTTTSWESKHPSGEYYFSEYAPLLSDDSLKFPEVENIPYVLNEFDMQEDLKAYFTRLISYAHSIHKIPVFKLEQAEGSAAWIRVNFPNSLYVGITRKADYQFISWLEQATFGNLIFFTLACQIINKNYKFFETDPIQQTGQYDIFAYQKIFDVFKRKIDIQHKLFMDFCIDISPESQETLSEQITKVKTHDPGRVEMWQHVLSKVKDSLIKETESQAMLRRLKIQVKNLSKLSAINTEQANQINTLNATLDEKLSAQITQLQAEAALSQAQVTQLQAEAALSQAQVRELSIELSESWNEKYMKLLKSLVKRIINRTKNFGHLSLKSVTHEIFDGIYKTNYWRGESRSGEGSDLIQTQQIREVFPVLLKSLGAKSMLDIPCGDYYWMQHVDLPVTYIGADIVQQVVKINNEKYSDIHHKFMHLDVCTDKLPQVDLIFARDLLVHLSYDDIRRALQNMKESGSTWLLTTTFTGRDSNIDIITVDWRTLNLQLTPFNFPEPVKIINEGCTQFNGDYNDKSLGLWKIQDINLWPCSDEQQPNNTKS